MASLLVLVHALGRDGELTCKLLTEAGHACHRCVNDGDLLSRLPQHPGVLVLAEEAVSSPLAAQLREFVESQQPWSDLPVIVVAQMHTPGTHLAGFAVLGNVSILTRPMAPDSLASAVAAALRARRRQLQVRDLMELQREESARKDRFLAMLAHELRNPLAPIRYAAYALQLGADGTSKVSGIASILERQVNHMARIIDQLLDVTRITRGLVRLDRRSLDLAQLVRQACELQQPVAEGKSVGLWCRADGPLWVDGDETRLRQVLDNLIDNALKFTRAGGQVRVVAGSSESLAKVEITDSGDGIEPHELQYVFEPFAQADRSLDRARGGLGLGLALVKGLVELHGGRVSVHSPGAGRGSAFTVLLPLAPATKAAEAAPEGAEAPTLAHPLRVLIAEDNKDAAETLRMILEAFGCEARVVHNGPAALEAASRLRPDALVCDIGLPGMSGYEVATALRSKSADGPALLLAVTGYGSADDRAAALAAGFDAHFSKPVSPAELMEPLRRLAAQRRGAPD